MPKPRVVSKETATAKPSTRESGREIHPEREIDGDEGKQSWNSRIGKQDAKRAAGEAKKKAFGDELAKKPAARGTERGANGNLTDARGRFDEQKIADVGAGDQEKQADCKQKRDHGFAIGAGYKIADGNSVGDPVVIDGGIFSVDLFEERFELAGDLFDGDTGFEASYGTQKIVGTRGFRGVHLKRESRIRHGRGSGSRRA